MTTVASSWLETARGRLSRVVGVPQAISVITEVLGEMGVETLESADSLAEFGERLSSRGGFLAAVGVSLKTHALLHSARGKT